MRHPEALDSPRATPIVKIIHVDMDAFFASVEQQDQPTLKGRPVVVGGDPQGRGVVAAASYEARRFGIRSAMACARAARLCPEAVFVRPRIDRYKEVSAQLRGIFHDVTPLVEPLSLDEAYLDVTTNHLDEPLAGRVAIHIKRRIRDEIGLTASAGVGPNKLVAKVASDLEKPDGLVIIPPAQVSDFIAALSVDRLWSVGPATAGKLRAMGLHTARDIRRIEARELERTLGRHGLFIHRLAHGDDPRRVEPDRTARSRSAETTFPGDVREIDHLLDTVDRLAKRVAEALTRLGRPGRTISVKVRYADFSTITRSTTLESYTDDAQVI
jgi:DNA polymerase-4